MRFNRHANGMWVPEAPFFNKYKDRDIEMVSVPVGIAGLIGWEQIRNGKVIRKSRLRSNLILDAGIDALINDSTAVNNLTQICEVGTSSQAPDPSDVDVIAPLSPRATTTSNGGFSDETGDGPGFEYQWFRQTRVFLEAEAIGNLTEVVFRRSSGGSQVFNRQLLLDDLGQPTTISKTNEDQLKIIVEFRLYSLHDIIEQVVNVNGIDYTLKTRGVRVQNHSNSAWGPQNATLVGSNANASCDTTQVMPAITSAYSHTNPRNSTVLGSYTSGSFYRDASYIWNPASANLSPGIGYIQTSHLSSGSTSFRPRYITTFEPHLPKTDTEQLTFTLRQTFQRVTPP